MTETTARRLTLERTYQADVQDVWDLWTTKDGIESWWGPEGFTVEVQELELRNGGKLVYDMTATAAPQVAFMKQANMPLTTRTRIGYVEVQPTTRLAYTTLADFIPGVEPYDVATLIELFPAGESVRMVLTFDAMHDEQWTKLATMGRESELERLAEQLAKRVK